MWERKYKLSYTFLIRILFSFLSLAWAVIWNKRTEKTSRKINKAVLATSQLIMLTSSLQFRVRRERVGNLVKTLQKYSLVWAIHTIKSTDWSSDVKIKLFSTFGMAILLRVYVKYTLGVSTEIKEKGHLPGCGDTVVMKVVFPWQGLSIALLICWPLQAIMKNLTS